MIDKDEWGTPDDLFKDLDDEFNFTLDPCASKKRSLKPGIENIFKEKDGLLADWSGHSVFVNPPYSGKNIELWIKKSYKQRRNAKDIVLLIPATKTGTKYFHRYIIPYADIRFVKGRVNFIPLAGQNNNSNPLYSLICIFEEGDD